jgi:hypothetical protein
MRSRFSEESLVGSTTRASSSLAAVWAASPAASSASSAVDAVDEERTAVREGLEEKMELRVEKLCGRAVAGKRRSEERIGRRERSKGTERVAIEAAARSGLRGERVAGVLALWPVGRWISSHRLDGAAVPQLTVHTRVKAFLFF